MFSFLTIYSSYFHQNKAIKPIGKTSTEIVIIIALLKNIIPSFN